MALTDTLKLIITADGAQAQSEFKKLGSSAEKELGKAKTSTDKLAAGMVKFGAGAAAIGIGLIAFGVQSAGVFTRVGMEVAKLIRYTDLSAESASRLRFAAKESGIDVDTLGKGLAILAKNAAGTPSKFQDLGIQVKDAGGKLRSTNDLLLDAADKVKNATTGTEKLAIAQKLFGKSGKDLLPLLARGKDGIDELAKSADKYGLVLNQSQVDMAKKATVAQRELGAAMEGAQVQIGAKFVPILTSITTELTKVVAGSGGAAANVAFFGGATLAAAGSVAVMVGKGKQLFDALKGMSQAQGAAAITVTGLAVAYGIWSHALDDASKSFSKALGPAETKAASASYQGLNDMLARTNTQIGDIDSSIKNSSAPWDADYRAELSQGGAKLEQFGEGLQKTISQTDDLSAATGDSKAKVLDWLQAQAKSGATFDDSASALAAYTGDLDSGSLSQEEYTAAVKAQDDALKALNDAMRATFDPLFGFQDAIGKNHDALAGITKATLDVAAAQKEFNDAVKEHGKKSPEAVDAYNKLTTAQQDLTKAQDDSVRSALDVDAAVNTLLEKVKTQPGLMQSAKDSIDKWAQQGLIGKDVAQGYKDKLDGLLGTAKALDNVDAHPKITIDPAQALAALHAISVAQAALSDVQLAAGYDRTTGGRAYGGTVHRGESYIVGDRRGMDTAEVFTPNDDGYISPSATGFGSGAPPVVHVYVGGREVEAEITTRQRTDQRGRR